MKKRILMTGTSITLLAALVSASAADRVTKTTTKVNPPATDRIFRTSGKTLIRKYDGNLSLEKAVEIALLQNPSILRAIEEIERTRGLIIEVRARALPQITLSGSYDQTDRRLLEGGGGRGGGGALGGNQGNGGVSGISEFTEAQPQVEQPDDSGQGGRLPVPDSGPTDGGAVGARKAGSAEFMEASRIGTRAASGVGTLATVGNAEVVQNAGVVQNAQVVQNINGVPNQGGATGGGEAAIDLAELFGDQGNAGSIQNKSWRIGIEARQVIYSGGQIGAALKIAKLTQDSSYYQLRDVVDQIISTVRQQFYSVLLNRALITVAEEAVRLQGEELRDQRNRFDAGTVPRFNVLRAEVELANVQPNLIRARNEYLIAQLQLARTLGLDPGPGGRPGFNVVGNLTVTPRTLALDDALMLAKARRPFLKVQRQSVLIETQQITVEMAGYKPRLDANAGYEIRNRSSSSDLGDTVNGWFFGVSGSWDIFDGFGTYGRVKQARARLEQSRINYYDSVRQVELEVQTAFADLRQAQETISSQQKNVEQALEALRLSQERLAAGAGTQLEVLDARVALTRARTTELQARADYSRALAEFDRSTATDTVYNDSWRDPLFAAEKGIFARLAETALPKPPADLDEGSVKKVVRKERTAVVRDVSKSR